MNCTYYVLLLLLLLLLLLNYYYYYYYYYYHYHYYHYYYYYRYYYLAPKKQTHVKAYDADRVTRAHLLWDLLLTRTKHKRNSIPRPVHKLKSMEVHKVPLKLG